MLDILYIFKYFNLNITFLNIDLFLIEITNIKMSVDKIKQQ